MSERGKQYAAFIEAELKAETDRRDSVNTRAATALTSAAGLVTLVLAVFAVLLGKDFRLAGLTGWAKAYLAVALFALLGSAICAVVAGRPWRIKLTKPKTLYMMINEHWNDSEEDARNNIAYANVEVIASLRPGTNIKYKFLIAAGVCQIIAVAALVLCTLSVLGIGIPSLSTLGHWTLRVLKLFALSLLLV